MLLALLANLSFFLAQNNRVVKSASTYEPDTSRPLASIPRLLLLAELPQPIEQQLTNLSEPSPADSEASDWCEIIGPFTTGQALDDIKMKLASAGFESEQLQVSSAPNARFWTYISPKGDRSNMLVTLAMLRKNNIDAYLLPYGEHINTISLKYFADRGEAEEFIDRMAQLDVLAEVVDLNEETVNLWLKTPRKSDSFLPNWVNDEYPDKKTLKDHCVKVANSAKFH